MAEEDGASVMPSKPFFIYVEAKRWQAFGIDANRVQPLAQIHAPVDDAFTLLNNTNFIYSFAKY